MRGGEILTFSSLCQDVSRRPGDVCQVGLSLEPSSDQQVMWALNTTVIYVQNVKSNSETERTAHSNLCSFKVHLKSDNVSPVSASGFGIFAAFICFFGR